MHDHDNVRGAVLRYLVEKGVRFTAVNHEGLTPLSYAAQHSPLTAVKILGEKGADVNSGGDIYYSVFEYLLRNGANVHARNNVARPGASVLI